MRKEIISYVQENIIPQYSQFDKAHQEDHAKTVIEQSLALAKYYDVDEEVVYMVAACHDLGLIEGRKTHHLASGSIIRNNQQLRQWFDESTIEIMAQAAEDHRASSDHEPRSIYGRIVAEADRIIDGPTIIRRTVQYGLSHYPQAVDSNNLPDREWHWERFVDHMKIKYMEGGYLKLWIPESPNAQRLEAFREFMNDRESLRKEFDRVFDNELSHL